MKWLDWLNLIPWVVRSVWCFVFHRKHHQHVFEPVDPDDFVCELWVCHRCNYKWLKFK